MLKCDFCGKEFLAKSNRRFCSLKCSSKSRVEPVETRFWRKVAKTDNPDDCWDWTGIFCKGTGYGTICFDGKPINAHRLAWILHNGSIEGRMDVCHKCDRRSCVNINHLFLGTRRENIHDAMRKGRLIRKTGDQNSCTAISDSQVEEIKSLAGKVLQRVIAERFNTSGAQISRIINGKRRAKPYVYQLQK